MPERDESQSGMGDLASAAHELRRPLGVAFGYLNMLLDGHLGLLTPSQRRAVMQVQAKLTETRHGLEQLVLQGRLEGDSVTPNVRRLDLVQETETAIERARARVELAGGRLRFDRPASAVQVLADSALLARILDNLLDNAIAYADDVPEVTLQAEVAERPLLRVCDGGIGMDPELREQIFARGFRADPTSTRPGSGLGLHLSRRAAHEMGAELSVEWTQPRHGTCFRLELQGTI